MDKGKNIYLTPSQFTIKLIGAMIGVGILYLPNSVIKDAKQDGWISCFIGAIYPVYMLIIAGYISKKNPKQNILIVCKKCLGAFLGNILNIIFLSFFLFITTTVLSGFANVFKIYATFFLRDIQIVLVVLLSAAYIVYKGLKSLGRLSEVIFYLVIILLIMPFGAFVYGSAYNVMPVLGSGLLNILKASKETVYYYCGMEFIFLIYPFLEDNKKLLKCGIISTVFVAVVYTWTVFLTIYYLGVDIAPKYFWPVIAITDSIKIPLINSFRYPFVALWAMIAIKCVATHYFSVAYGLSTLIKSVSREKFTIILYPLIIYLAMKYGNPTTRREISDKLVEIYALFNFFYVSIIAMILAFKRGGINEKK